MRSIYATNTPPAVQSAPGSFNIDSGNGVVIVKRLVLAGAQRLTLLGTSRLRLT